MLLAFGILLIGQDSELVARRAEDGRALVARQWTDSLYQRLERAYAAPSAGPKGRRYRTAAPLLELGAFDGQALKLHGDPPTASTILDRGFQDFLIATTRVEIAEGRALVAADRYGTRRAGSHEQQAFLRLRAARAFRSAGRAVAFRRHALEALAEPDSVTDEFGTPIAYYAASLFLADSSGTEVEDRLDPTPEGWLTGGAATLYLGLRERAGLADDSSTRRFRNEQSLSATLTAASVTRSASPAAPRWVVDPSGEWLLRLADGGRVKAEFLVAVALDSLGAIVGAGAPLVKFRALADVAEPSGPPFRGLAADVQTNSPNGIGRRVASWGLVLLFLYLALFSGSLLWRDVRRETRLADLRSQFVSSVSHELRTPLTSIRLYAESMMAFGADDREERDKDLGVIASESERLTRMLDNVLTTSRIEKGTMRYRLQLGSPTEASADSSRGGQQSSRTCD